MMMKDDKNNGDDTTLRLAQDIVVKARQTRERERRKRENVSSGEDAVRVVFACGCYMKLGVVRKGRDEWHTLQRHLLRLKYLPMTCV